MIGLGDAIASALTLIGVTAERVSAWVGAPCGCKERQDKLNRLGWWAARILSGKRDRAADYLDGMIEDG